MVNADCAMYIPSTYLKADNICAISDNGNTGVCNDDFGGPLVAEGILIGISSFSMSCANGFPDVYVRVPSFAPWIEKTLAK